MIKSQDMLMHSDELGSKENDVMADEKNRVTQQEILASQQVLRMEVEARPENEAFARTVIAAFMTRLDPTLEELNDVKTAVSEAVTNCIIHGYENKGGIIEITVTINEDIMTVTIIDSGVGIEDILKAMEPMYSGNPALERSGMGFSFMEVFMDSLYVDSKRGCGTTVRMTKKVCGRH